MYKQGNITVLKDFFGMKYYSSNIPLLIQTKQVGWDRLKVRYDMVKLQREERLPSDPKTQILDGIEFL